MGGWDLTVSREKGTWRRHGTFDMGRPRGGRPALNWESGPGTRFQGRHDLKLETVSMFVLPRGGRFLSTHVRTYDAARRRAPRKKSSRSMVIKMTFLGGSPASSFLVVTHCLRKPHFRKHLTAGTFSLNTRR